MKVTGSCEPRTIWAATSTQTLRRARASGTLTAASVMPASTAAPPAYWANRRGMVGRIIESDADVAEGAAHLAAIDRASPRRWR